jgi:hypothetical protein
MQQSNSAMQQSNSAMQQSNYQITRLSNYPIQGLSDVKG